MDGYKYYSTQRPVDIWTFPEPPDNKPVEIKNYDCDFRIPIPGEAFRAWGELIYAKPLTDKQMEDYELKPSRQNPDLKDTRPRKMGGQPPFLRAQTADVVPPGFWFLCAERLCDPGTALGAV